ncbi:DMT family transporter [Shewanella sp.]|uniref:DMT family transporter n=1 Tax=Shewanella sp. TaxID=50422 RepID=UPI00258B558B|nr:DMT family transporter [Shewanella sp.]MCJ8302871.1 DMT family transporter [Shewanella sp.]
MNAGILSQIPLSVRFMLLSALAFSLMSACVKLVSADGIPVLEIIAARALVSLGLSYIDVKRKGISMWGHNRKLLLARGAIGTLALFCVYYSLITLPLAEATLLQYLHPMFTALLAFIFLGERVLHSTKVCITLSILGLLVMVLPGLGVDQQAALPWASIGIALLGALGSSIAYVIVRRLSNIEDVSVIILYFPLIALPLSIFLLGSDFVMPNFEGLLLLLFVGVFTQVGQVGLTKAMQSESAGKAAGYAYVQVIFAMLFGWIIFSELPSIWSWIGGSIIMIGALVNVLWKR